MNHEKWDDDKIEELLSNVPKVHDHRSKEEVLSRLKDEGVLEEQPSQDQKPKKKKVNWMPYIVSAAAVILLALFIPMLMDQMNEQEDMATQEMKSRDANDEAGIMNTENSMEMSTMIAAPSLKTAVYPEELEGKTIFQLGLASDAADSVPVTVLIPNEKIQQDFETQSPTGVELYNKYATDFNEAAVGFAEYHPYIGTISEQGEQVLHTLPTDQNYDMASAALATYQASIIDTFSHYYSEAVFLNEDGSNFTFSEVGQPSEPLQLKNKQYNYFKHTQNDGTQYLVPNFRATYETVEEAIEAMKVETNDIYQTLILENVDFDVALEENVVTITFKEQLDLINFDQGQAMQMIEGILLTASNFNMQVQLQNVVQQQWEGFDFSNPLPMPISPNELPYDAVFQ